MQIELFILYSYSRTIESKSIFVCFGSELTPVISGLFSSFSLAEARSWQHLCVHVRPDHGPGEQWDASRVLRASIARGTGRPPASRTPTATARRIITIATCWGAHVRHYHALPSSLNSQHGTSDDQKHCWHNLCSWNVIPIMGATTSSWRTLVPFSTSSTTRYFSPFLIISCIEIFYPCNFSMLLEANAGLYFLILVNEEVYFLAVQEFTLSYVSNTKIVLRKFRSKQAWQWIYYRNTARLPHYFGYGAFHSMW